MANASFYEIPGNSFASTQCICILYQALYLEIVDTLCMLYVLSKFSMFAFTIS